MSSNFSPFMQALLWTCKSCGFVYEGGQPKQNCPSCEAYKASFIDIPQHIEAKVRETYPDLPPNHAQCRALRLDLMSEEQIGAKHRLTGRILPSRSGEHINPSESF